MRVRFAPEACAAVRRKRAWWEAHREKAPQLFREELRDAVTKLRSAPAEGQRYMLAGGRTIWRILMPKTKNHVYYRISEDTQEVEVLTVWNALSGEAPTFE